MAILRDLDIFQFRPDPHDFDAEKELLVVRFEASDRLYLSHLGRWAVALEDPTMPQSFLRIFLSPEYRFGPPGGVVVDKARVGEVALFSELGKPNKNLWRSTRIVTDIEIVRRRSNMRSKLDLHSRMTR